MKPFTLILSLALPLFVASLQQNNDPETTINQSSVFNHELKCPAPPSFAQIVKNDIAEQFAGNSGKDIDQSWYEKAIMQIDNEEYNISYNDDISAYQSPNRANNIRFIYHNEGFTAKTRTNKVPLFEANDKTLKEEEKKYETLEEFEVELGITNEEFKIAGNSLQASGNKAWIENEKIRIDYTNKEEGMRQDFTIKQRSARGGKLKLNFEVNTKLRMIVGADALMFKNEDGIDQMKYSALKVWDANGRELRAYFENIKSRNPPAVKAFSIVVNDEDAIYPVTIDPLSTSPSWTAESNQADAQFGVVVATAGDVNGDGYSDIVVGAPLFDNGQLNEGKVFVYNGSAAGPSSSSSWSAESDQTSAEFGNNVATAGDVNGDGFSDLVVGAYRFDNGQNDEGRSFVYHGSASGLSLTPNWTAESNQADARFGLGVSTAGDVNGDGYGDLVVGAYQYDNNFTDEGCIFVYSGTASGLLTTASWIVFGSQAGAGLGASVATAGDVNGDGFGDVIAGAYAYDNGQTDEGAAFAYYGSPSGISLFANWSKESNQNFAYYGICVATAGDVNGDGYSEVIVGAHQYDNGQTDEGAAFVYDGSSTGLSVAPGWTGEGNQTNSSYGLSVHTAGDVNGDGFADIIVGAYLYDNGQSDEGGSFVYYGSLTGLSPAANWFADCNQVNSAFGWSVSTAGDINGDGYSDVITGARFFDNGQNDEGKAFEYNGSPAGLASLPSWTTENNQSSSALGLSVSMAGDVNGDGYNDAIIGAPLFDNGQTDEGRAYVFHGSATGLSGSANWTAELNIASAGFGNSVSTAGDVNDDGYCDVIIGAPYLASGGAYVYFGSSAGLPANASWSKSSNQFGSQFGISVSTAGDVNGDGYSEVLIGANLYSNGQNLEGRAFCYYGSSSGPTASPSWTAESNQVQAEFGASLASAGDVNGDGYSDVLIGCYKYDDPLTDEGKAFLYMGSSTGLAQSAAWTAKGNQTGCRFSQSLSTAGDANGDGFKDVIVSAYLYDLNFTDEGCAFYYPGSVTGLSPTASWIAFGAQNGAFFGASVSTAGDVNGDGYSDVIVGAPYYDNGQSDEGAAFVYNGSASGLSLFSGWSSESDQANSYYGISVSSSGDVNGDGYSDILIGASQYDNGQSDEGRVYSYYGNNGTSLRSTMNQYKPFTSNVVYSGGMTGTAGGVRLNVFGKSPFGRTPGKIVYEHKQNGQAYSGPVITNSTLYSGAGNFTAISGTGISLNHDVSGLIPSKEYKWRARVEYKLASNPYQKMGPWKYYENFVPLPNWSFRPSVHAGHGLVMNLTMLIQGFYNPSTNFMQPDTLKVYLHQSLPPYTIDDSANAVADVNGQGTFIFSNAVNGGNYFIQLDHRNSIETWSKTPQTFTNDSLTYDFTTANTQAYGDNMIQVDASPVRFAIYGGDVNKDGTIDVTDLGIIDNDVFSFTTGYVVTDLTGDNNVDISDLLIADNNAANFVGVVRP